MTSYKYIWVIHQNLQFLEVVLYQMDSYSFDICIEESRFQNFYSIHNISLNNGFGDNCKIRLFYFYGLYLAAKLS
jgi:hypothetical protein